MTRCAAGCWRWSRAGRRIRSWERGWAGRRERGWEARGVPGRVRCRIQGRETCRVRRRVRGWDSRARQRTRTTGSPSSRIAIIADIECFLILKLARRAGQTRVVARNDVVLALGTRITMALGTGELLELAGRAIVALRCWSRKSVPASCTNGALHRIEGIGISSEGTVGTFIAVTHCSRYACWGRGCGWGRGWVCGRVRGRVRSRVRGRVWRWVHSRIRGWESGGVPSRGWSGRWRGHSVAARTTLVAACPLPSLAVVAFTELEFVLVLARWA
jgi:hypothetical protein